MDIKTNYEDTMGYIFDISRFCLNDGPGIRTTVFLKGCPFHCLWCHNPEGISPHIQLSNDDKKCNKCGACISICPNKCHRISCDKHYIDYNSCIACGKCVAVCQQKALELIGKKISVKEIIDVVKKDIYYYKASGGGVTLSGGEVLYQPDFAFAVLHELKKLNIHTCIETSGAGEHEAFVQIAKATDIVLFDYKQSDTEQLYQQTGINMSILKSRLELLETINKSVILRCPMIKGINDSQSHIEEISKIALSMKNVLRVDLLPYHNLGCDKAMRLNLSCIGFLPPSPEKLIQFTKYLKNTTGKISD